MIMPLNHQEKSEYNSDLSYLLEQGKIPSVAIVGVQSDKQSIYNAYKDKLSRLVIFHFPSELEAPECVRHNKPDYIVVSQKYVSDVQETLENILPNNGTSKYIIASDTRIPKEDLCGIDVCCTLKEYDILSMIKSIDTVLQSYKRPEPAVLN
jgi:hypothetical protein